MASVTSLGLSSPAGLAYAIQERYLDADPQSTSYTCDIYSNYAPDFSFEEDELLVTSRCVIWSRGGVFRKCYNFDMEKEIVSHALLTTFPRDGPPNTKKTNPTKNPERVGTSEAAIVVFLKTQAHVYFLFGTSHIVHLPFEVESAFAAPNGVILQRKFSVDTTGVSLKFPRAPQNSFVSSQPQSWSAASSLHSTFSVTDFVPPRQISLSHSIRKDAWDPPLINADKNWPRLFSLSDPLAEIGLIVLQPPYPESHEDKSNLRTSQLDVAEEILHVSRRDEFSSKETCHPLVLTLTWNRETSKYTLWELSYLENLNRNDRTKITGINSSRRVSSYAPVTSTGATTPVMVGQQKFRDTNISNPVVVSRKSLKSDDRRDKVTDFVSALDVDLQSQITPRRKCRRVSSMLARADLSASHERSAFSDLAASHQYIPNRRGESFGSQHTRSSFGALGTSNIVGFSQASQLNQNFNDFVEASGDDLLDDLRAEDDSEEFTSTGFETGDFDALKQEIFLTKVSSVPAEYDNFRYSSHNKPAATQCKVFTMAAPPCAADEQRGNSKLICILHPDDKKLIIITLYTLYHPSDGNPKRKYNDVQSEEDIAVVSLGPILRAEHVIDACRIDDGQISRILVLSETEDGFGELTLQAPWSTLMKVPLPTQFSSTKIRSISLDLQNPKRGILNRPRAPRGLRNPRPPGRVDLLDDQGNLHQLRLLLQPQNPHVCKVLDLCREIVPVKQDMDTDSSNRVDGFLVCWWNIMQWLSLNNIDTPDQEWSALVITLLAANFGIDKNSRLTQNCAISKTAPQPDFLYYSTGFTADVENLELMQAEETNRENSFPSWAENAGWNWLIGDVDFSSQVTNTKETTSWAKSKSGQRLSFIQKHVRLAYEYTSTAIGKSSLSECLPTWANKTLEYQIMALKDLFIGLHLLREEQKLDVMNCDAFSSGRVSLTSILAQIALWLGWSSWVRFYEAEEALFLASDLDTGKYYPFLIPNVLILLDTPIQSVIPEPFDCPNIYNWLQKCLSSQSSEPFMTISHLIAKNTASSDKGAHDRSMRLTPRTLMFKKFFEIIGNDWCPVRVVEALSSAGADALMFETLPEAILAPLQEAVIHCQSEPPVTWSNTLLTLIGREDVNISLTRGQRPRNAQPKILVGSLVLSRML